MSRVGDKLKEVREASGLTQKSLAKKLGVSDKFINEVEAGRRVVNESFIDRASKVLKVDLNEISLVVTDKDLEQDEKQPIVVSERKKKVSNKIIGDTEEVWTEAFSSVLKKVPILNYALNKELGYRELPIYSNKVENIPCDKVIYLECEDNSMVGFKISKKDRLFGTLTKTYINEGIYLIEINQKRYIRHIKASGQQKIIVLSNDGNVRRENYSLSEIKFIAKFNKIEISI